MKDPYQAGSAIQKITDLLSLGKRIRLAFLDIDSTSTGTPASQQHVRDTLEEKGYIVIFVTARTSELCISWGQRKLSSERVQRRLPALVQHQGKQMTPLDPATLPAFRGLIDPYIIASTNGSEVLIQQASGGYEYDDNYYELMDVEEKEWRNQTSTLIENILQDRFKTAVLSPAEYAHNYQQGYASVSEPPYRIEMDFTDRDEKEDFIIQLEKRNKDLAVTDESDETATPATYKLYIMPAGLGKRQAVDYIVQQIYKKFPDMKHNTEVLIAGDAYADLNMGLHGAPDAHTTFLIPGGAKLSRHFADAQLQRKNRLDRTVLSPTGHHGFYAYGPQKRTVIIGDEAYPKTIGSQTLLAYLKEIGTDALPK